MNFAVSDPQIVPIVNVEVVVPVELTRVIVQNCVETVPIGDPRPLIVGYLSELVERIRTLKTSYKPYANSHKDEEF